MVARTVLKLLNVCIGEQSDAIYQGTLLPILIFFRIKPELLLLHEGDSFQVKSSSVRKAKVLSWQFLCGSLQRVTRPNFSSFLFLFFFRGRMTAWSQVKFVHFARDPLSPPVLILVFIEDKTLTNFFVDITFLKV